MGFEPEIFDKNIGEIETLLAKQDIINLASFLAEIYGMFCPKQYDNELNIDIHNTVTAPEIDQQLHENGDSLENYDLVCSFGTGGTSGGLSKYMSEKYNKKAVHVVFPPQGQDVAGIRTHSKAEGLTLYNPEAYTEHVVDFEKAKFLLKFFVDKGYDIGESTALELYSTLEMVSAGLGSKFVIMVFDGIEKYRKNFEQISQDKLPMRISLEDAASVANEYDRIVWVHTQYTPKEEGIEMIAKSLGVDKSKIAVPKAGTINTLLSTQEVPEELSKEFDGSNGKSLLVCMAGNTSFMTAQVLASKGIVTQSLNGGITDLPEGRGKNPGEYIQIALENNNLKCLSVSQPFADLIISGKKTIELRKWNTNFRGEFLVHAPLKIRTEDCKRLKINHKLVTGAIVGKAELYDVKKYNSKKEVNDDKQFHFAGKKISRQNIWIYVKKFQSI